MTTIDGAFVPGGDIDPSGVMVLIDEAPSKPSSAYASDFDSSPQDVDGWSAYGTGALVEVIPFAAGHLGLVDSLRLRGPNTSGVEYHCARLVTGLMSAYLAWSRTQCGKVRQPDCQQLRPARCSQILAFGSSFDPSGQMIL